MAWTPIAWTPLKVLGAVLCFWTVQSIEIINTVTYGSTEMASYPLPSRLCSLPGAQGTLRYICANVGA